MTCVYCCLDNLPHPHLTSVCADPSSLAAKHKDDRGVLDVWKEHSLDVDLPGEEPLKCLCNWEHLIYDVIFSLTIKISLYIQYSHIIFTFLWKCDNCAPSPKGHAITVLQNREFRPLHVYCDVKRKEARPPPCTWHKYFHVNQRSQILTSCRALVGD